MNKEMTIEEKCKRHCFKNSLKKTQPLSLVNSMKILKKESSSAKGMLSFLFIMKINNLNCKKKPYFKSHHSSKSVSRLLESILTMVTLHQYLIV